MGIQRSISTYGVVPRSTRRPSPSRALEVIIDALRAWPWRSGRMRAAIVLLAAPAGAARPRNDPGRATGAATGDRIRDSSQSTPVRDRSARALVLGADRACAMELGPRGGRFAGRARAGPSRAPMDSAATFRDRGTRGPGPARAREALRGEALALLGFVLREDALHASITPTCSARRAAIRPAPRSRSRSSPRSRSGARGSRPRLRRFGEQ